MSTYHRKHEMTPEDRKEDKKLLTREHLEKGDKTSQAEKNRLMGNKKKPTKK